MRPLIKKNRYSVVLTLDAGGDFLQLCRVMNIFRNKYIALASIALFVVALATPAEARRNTTNNPPPPIGTQTKPVVSPL